MKTVILGASGFIGNALYKRLRDSVGTYNSNKKEGLVPCDCLNYDEVVKFTKGVEVVYVLCAKTYGVDVMVDTPEAMVRENLIMNANILQACAFNKVKQVVFVGSSTAYQMSYRPLTEDEMDYNQPPYPLYMGIGWVKRYVEKLCEFYHQTKGMDVTIIRPTNVYGPGDKIGKGSHFIPGVISRLLKNPKKLVVWGKGHTKKNFVYIDNMVDALIDVKGLKGYNIFNFGSPETHSVKDIVDRIVMINGEKTKVSWDETKPESIPYRELNYTKYISHFGRVRHMGMNEGLRRTIKWAKEQHGSGSTTNS